MPSDDLAGGQCNGTVLLQQGVQTHQYTRLHDRGRLLDLHQVAVLQGADEIRLHVGVGLTGIGCFGLDRTQLLNLVRHLAHDLSHAVLRCRAGFGMAGELLIGAFRVIVHIIQIGQAHDRFDIRKVDAAHLHQLLPLPVQIRVPGRGAVGVREHLADEVVDLGIGRTGILHIGQIEACGNRLGALGLAGAGRAAEQEIAHGQRLSRGLLRVGADTDHLSGKHIPRFQNGDQRLFAGGKHTAGRQNIFPDKVAVGHHLLRLQHNGCGGMGQDGELSRQYMIRRKAAGVQMGLGDPYHIARVVDTDRQMGRAGLVVHPPVGVVAEDRCQLCRFRQVGKGVPILRDKVIQRIRKFRIRRKGGDHGQKNSSAVLAGLAYGVGLYHLGTVVIFAGQYRPSSWIIDRQVVSVRAGGGLVLRHTLLPTEANSPRF